MNFQASADHAALMDAVQALVDREQAARTLTPERFEYLPPLRERIVDAGFFGCLDVPELGALAAADVVMTLSQLPFAVEVLASSLIAPLACPERAGPCALVGDALDRPLRYLPVASTLVRIRGAQVHVAALTAADVQTVPSIFAYPMGVLTSPETLVWSPVAEAVPGTLERLWRIGVAAEIAGCLQAALHSVLEHVRHRRQFGRPLGSFQAIQHRLAQAAGKIDGVRWLVLRAAGTSQSHDALAASAQAQDIATQVSYDLHQFVGAMGLTLEHPLHRWTYRVKLLRAELGGAAAQFAQLADAAWPEAAVEAVA